MTVYVDQFPEGWGKWTGGGHMLGTDIDELHEMASAMGLRRSWFQGKGTFPHYDLTASKRSFAIRQGAVEIEIGEIPDDVLMLRRDTGEYERRSDRKARQAAAKEARDAA